MFNVLSAVGCAWVSSGLKQGKAKFLVRLIMCLVEYQDHEKSSPACCVELVKQTNPTHRCSQAITLHLGDTFSYLLKQKWSRGWDKVREGKEGARPLSVIWVPHSLVWLLQGVCTTVGTQTLLSVKRISKDFPRGWKIVSSQIGKALTS